MLVLGIQKDHNSSVCAYKNGDLIYYCQEERLSKEKRTSDLPINCINQFANKFKCKIDVAIVTSYDFDSSIYTIGSYLKFLNLIDDSKDQVYSFYKSHHLLHAAKAFYDSGFKDAIVFVVDGRGSAYNLTNGSTGNETSSVYHFSENFYKCVYKKIYTNQKNINNLKINMHYEGNMPIKMIPISYDKKTKIELTNKWDLGHFYSAVSVHFNFRNEEGKLMGLSAYGKDDKNLKKIIDSKDFFINDPSDKENLRGLTNINIKKYPQLILNENNNKSLNNLAFLTQKKFEIGYKNLIKKHLNNDFSKNLILTGGTALNVVNNFKIKNFFKNNNLFVEPLCGDEGNSIAGCQFLLKQVLNPNIKFKKLEHLFIGNEYDYKINCDNKKIILKEIKLNEIINLLVNGEIIALFQGKAEAGPRALGNRSLLLDPRIKNGKDIMNKIKKRESFRPFACSVLKEEVQKWFDVKKLEESPFMMYAVNAVDKYKEKIKSIVHIDNTCRIQTITENYNKILYQILKEFYKKTKVPMLMNTSFNLANDPLVETPKDAIQMLEKSELKYVYFADKNLLACKLNN